MINHWINGHEVESDYVFIDHNPATGEVIAEVASGGPKEVAWAVDAAKKAFAKWAGTPARERARLMRKLGELIEQNAPRLAALETMDTGLPIHQTTTALIPGAVHSFNYYAEFCPFMDARDCPLRARASNYSLYQPVGVCALISPWSAPFMAATCKVAPCLSLGNTAVLKVSELSPITADQLGRLAVEAGLPKGVLNIIQGYGANAGNALVRHPDVSAISFMGGTSSGNKIMQSIGRKKYAMELGGKSPMLIFEDAQMEHAVEAAIFAAFSLNGERGVSGSRIFIQESVYPQFVAEFAARAKRLIVGDPRDATTQVGAMISLAHYEKVKRYIRTGIDEGATLLAGGLERPANLPSRLKEGQFVQPTVFADVQSRMHSARQEIFGPVVCLIPFKGEADALRLTRDLDFSLALNIWTDDIAKAHRLAYGMVTDSVFINNQNVWHGQHPLTSVSRFHNRGVGQHYSIEVFADKKTVRIFPYSS
jgi:5-carboxymethyl-2-hydroxymuconic-semialdehyde dehydrogenase